jgi:transcriptional regulator with GAF, ATPase, and Fis domain
VAKAETAVSEEASGQVRGGAAAGIQENKMASTWNSYQPDASSMWPGRLSEGLDIAGAGSEEVLSRESVGSSQDTGTSAAFEGIIGASPALKRVLEEVMTVAPTDSTVLIEGETGTGKELIARAIHNLSPRRERNFVKLNCAAIPLGLLESELFGHERGAFTGAIVRRIGRFELADKATLFLDEVGDIPLELQAKLLRILQEQEFEKLGSTHTQRVDVRLVAATNRDLKQMVSQKLFRSDLYFRVNIFPVTVPPLRERREDIPMLVKAFVDEYARRMHRRVDTISAETMAALTRSEWPGNVRELQNFIERAVILSPGRTLRAPLESLSWSEDLGPAGAVTLEQAECDHILKTLRETNWVIGGPKGAAERLGLKRTTLISKMRRLGLTRPSHPVAS